MCRPPCGACCSAAAAARRGCSRCGACSDWAVACMKRMTGPAWIVCIAQRMQKHGDRRHLDHAARAARRGRARPRRRGCPRGSWR